MQAQVDWTTGGISFYDADPPKHQNVDHFTPDFNVNSEFDPVPSMYNLKYPVLPSTKGFN